MKDYEMRKSECRNYHLPKDSWAAKGWLASTCWALRMMRAPPRQVGVPGAATASGEPRADPSPLGAAA
jgi:hypothetical protein